MSHQRKIAEDVQALGGEFAWVTRWGCGISLRNRGINDQDLRSLQQLLPQVAWLDLSENPLGDAALVLLRSARRLEELELHGTRVTGMGLVQLRSLPKLVAVRAGDTGVTSQDVLSWNRSGWLIDCEIHRRGPHSGWLPGLMTDRRAEHS